LIIPFFFFNKKDNLKSASAKALLLISRKA